MKLLPLVLLLLAITCLAFGAWGCWTTSGREAFDEMAGMIPMASLGLGSLLALGALAIWLLKTS